MYYNLASFALGLMAWILGTIGLFARDHKSRYQFSSFVCCCTALVLQFYEIKRRCALEDWSAIDDTISGVSFCALVLTVVTVFLNLLCQRRKKGED